MSESKVEHATAVVERRFRAVPARVFAAWADAALNARWAFPGKSWVLAENKQDFRVGGRVHSRFGPKEDPQYYSEGIYLDIVPDRRIVSAYAMHDKERRFSTTLCTVETRPDGDGTHMVLTDQTAFLRGETPSDRRQGLEEMTAKLEAFLRG
jgi:uncharacterized protein YndB with AHSA1/START domain